jgi:hypothetical protein
MAIIDLTPWSFKFGGGSPALIACGLASTPTSFHFPTSLDLLTYLASDATWEPAIQGDIQRQLKADLEANSWHQKRDLLRNLKHYPKYKGQLHDAYHAAARHVETKTATKKQTLMANGLNCEIAASRLVVPLGQILFHGCADLALTSTASYTAFISTSLDPVVAICSALRRGGISAVNGHPTVYLLTVRYPLQALWGNGGKPHEWEVLLQSGLACRATSTHPGSRFDIVEATVGL